MKKYGEVMVWALKKARKSTFKKGEVVRVAYEIPGLPLAEAVFTALVKEGYNPVTKATETAAMERAFYEHGSDDQLKFIPAGTKELNDNLNGSIFIIAPESLTHLAGIKPTKISTAMVARKPFRDILWRREEKGAFSWTLCLMATPANSSSSKMSVKEYEKQIIKACFLDKKDPVAEWEKIYVKSGEIKTWLNKMNINLLHIESAKCDLKITLGEKRKWLGCSGHNIPSFEIFTSPDWRGTEGIYFANLPSYRTGNYIEDVRLEFKKGKAVSVKAGKGDAFVKEMLKSDKTANQIGEFSLTDKRFSRIDKFMAETLYDENFGGKNGNCHVAVGSAYTDAYTGKPADLTPAMKKSLGFNDSSLHWDLVNTEDKRVTATLKDGSKTVIYEKGMFRV
ncbi:MAG: aminopeptidase [Fibrobacteres bacterium]|nr:aminopeptidase [Fibrobacterota bacterium]